ncbi:hypothetical protein [Ewingella americana]|uniref:Uncharacterized protein n=1 Tax=Ewingella americana TaxID=41202 RepID=A0A502GDY8_9GAMM|nr:hypothetical protein [Ewingella americana]TPG60084.1 hypothetical protein EAH77_16075 [Ewingella americana]
MRAFATIMASLSSREHLLQVSNGTAYDLTRSEIIAICTRAGFDIEPAKILVIANTTLQVTSKEDFTPRRNLQASNVLTTMRAASEQTAVPFAEAGDTVVYLHNAIQTAGVIKRITASQAVVTNSVLGCDHLVNPSVLLKVSQVSAGYAKTEHMSPKDIAAASLGLI